MLLRPAAENSRSTLPEKVPESAEIWIRDPIGVLRCSPQSGTPYMYIWPDEFHRRNFTCKCQQAYDRNVLEKVPSITNAEQKRPTFSASFSFPRLPPTSSRACHRTTAPHSLYFPLLATVWISYSSHGVPGTGLDPGCPARSAAFCSAQRNYVKQFHSLHMVKTINHL
jgi:hypothetical protein